MAQLSAKRRRELVERLTHEAEQRGLVLIKRERTKGRWVWDARSEVHGLVLRGASLAELADYLVTRRRDAG